MGTLVGICISDERGTQKHPVQSIKIIENYGLDGDAHAGNWHRQVSLLSLEKIEEFRSRGAEVSFGAFGENLIVDGFDFRNLPVGTRFRIGDCLLEMTQIGKACHSHCEIYKVMGDCIMPREGVFAKVLKGGTVSVGTEVEMIPIEAERAFTAAVITLSDKGVRGEREDKSGPLLKKRLEEAGFEIIETLLLPDDKAKIQAELIRLADQRQVNLIMTTGGTGFAERDVTPEATKAVMTKDVPGIAEAIRAGSMKITRRAMLSREASVIRNKTLIINLPGSPKAVDESLDMILDQLDHGLGILLGRAGECARK